MFPLYPPDDPYLFQITLFDWPLSLHWYGVLIMSGALLAASSAARRATCRRFDPNHGSLPFRAGSPAALAPGGTPPL